MLRDGHQRLTARSAGCARGSTSAISLPSLARALASTNPVSGLPQTDRNNAGRHGRGTPHAGALGQCKRRAPLAESAQKSARQHRGAVPRHRARDAVGAQCARQSGNLNPFAAPAPPRQQRQQGQGCQQHQLLRQHQKSQANTNHRHIRQARQTRPKRQAQQGPAQIAWNNRNM